MPKKVSLDPNFKEFIELLNSAGVKYLLVGGYAVNYHGYDRFTGDIDFWIGVDLDNAQKVSTALQGFGFAAESVKPESFMDLGKIHVFGAVPLRVDLLTDPSGVTFNECYARRLDVEWAGVKVSIISLADLLANKIASDRDKDRLDVKELKRRTQRA